MSAHTSAPAVRPDRLRVAVWEFLSDWRKGDFALPRLAELDALSMEEAFTATADIANAASALKAVADRCWVQMITGLSDADAGALDEAFSRLEEVAGSASPSNTVTPRRGCGAVARTITNNQYSQKGQI